mgnify:CR=1 FL=1
MVKRILKVLVLIIALFAVAYSIHNLSITQTLSFSLLGVYLFHAIGAFLVYVVVEFVSDHLPSQAGYAYLMMMFFKMGAFLLIFQSNIFANENLLQVERIALVVPLLLFLMLEAATVGLLLNSK